MAREQDIPAGQGQIYLCDWPAGGAPRPLFTGLAGYGHQPGLGQ